MKAPGNRWTTEGSKRATDTVELDLGKARNADHLRLFFLDDGPGEAVRAPVAYSVEYQDSGLRWRAITVPDARGKIVGHRPTDIRLPQPLAVRRIRISLTPRPGAAAGLTEIEAWGVSPVEMSKSSREHVFSRDRFTAPPAAIPNHYRGKRLQAERNRPQW